MHRTAHMAPKARATRATNPIGPAAPVPAWRWREREAAWLAGALILACALWTLWPDLDLLLSRPLHRNGIGFVGQHSAAVQSLYQAVPWIGRGLALAGLLLWLGGAPARRLVGARWHRRARVLALLLLVGVGGLVSGVLKEQWGRARPQHLVALGGQAQFDPALRPSLQCRTNCSFVSGHAATGFALMGVGLLGAPATRRRWLCVGGVAGSLVGLARMAQGGHFASDIVFAGIAVWASAAALRYGWLRWRAARLRRRAALSSARGLTGPDPS